MKKLKGWFPLLLALLALLLAGCSSGKESGGNYTWDDRAEYAITADSAEHATLYVTEKGEKVTRAAEGSTLYINVVPETGYRTESITVNGQKVTDAKFVMPAGGVTVSAVVRPIVSRITVDAGITGGTVTADRETAMYGETVTLTVTPAPGYMLPERSLTVNRAEICRRTVTEETKITFRMPPNDVSISARFAENALHLTTVSEYLDFAARVNGGEDYAGVKVYLDADIGSEAEPVTAIVGNASNRAFAGTFEGNGHTVYLQITATKAAGMFGYVNGATVRNVTVAGTVDLTAANYYAAGLIGMVQWANGAMTTVENCVNTATVNVTATSNAGGFVGRTLGHLTITGCINRGDVTTKGNYAAGFVGYIIKSSSGAAPSLVIRNSANEGNITGQTGIGGFDGLFHKDSAGGTHVLENVSNTGTVTGTSQVGGIVATISSQAANGFDITISYRNAGLTGTDGNDVVVGSDGNKKTTVITRLTAEDAAEGGAE